MEMFPNQLMIGTYVWRKPKNIRPQETLYWEGIKKDQNCVELETKWGSGEIIWMKSYYGIRISKNSYYSPDNLASKCRS